MRQLDHPYPASQQQGKFLCLGDRDSSWWHTVPPAKDTSALLLIRHVASAYPPLKTQPKHSAFRRPAPLASSDQVLPWMLPPCANRTIAPCSLVSNSCVSSSVPHPSCELLEGRSHKQVLIKEHTDLPSQPHLPCFPYTTLNSDNPGLDRWLRHSHGQVTQSS